MKTVAANPTAMTVAGDCGTVPPRLGSVAKQVTANGVTKDGDVRRLRRAGGRIGSRLAPLHQWLWSGPRLPLDRPRSHVSDRFHSSAWVDSSCQLGARRPLYQDQRSDAVQFDSDPSHSELFQLGGLFILAPPRVRRRPVKLLPPHEEAVSLKPS